MPYNFKLKISYDGTPYCGWQIQPNGMTIQELIQQAISIILKSPVSIIGAGRTDAGVHALGQVAHFHYYKEIDLYRLHGSLNGLLPPEIRINEINEVPMEFHAQHSALKKIYHYHLYLERILNPFNRLYSVHIRKKIDLDRLKRAATFFLGTQDFTSFANEAHSGAASKNAIRTLHRLDVEHQPGGVRLEFEADGFLYKMVRNIVGCLLEIASGDRAIEDIPLIFAAKDRRRAGKAAPPHGLFLMQVVYPDFLSAKVHIQK